MDLASAVRRSDIINLLRRKQAKGLCEKEEKGGFVPRGRGRGKG